MMAMGHDEEGDDDDDDDDDDGLCMAQMTSCRGPPHSV